MKQKINIEYGLTTKQVEQRKINGDVNIITKVQAKSVKEIVLSNSMTLFNGLNIGLALMVIIAGSPSNALFAFVIVSNTFIGIFQEIRARITLEKLSLLNTFFVDVLRDGVFSKIGVTEVVLDDIVKFETGQQISIDGVVCSHEAEVDESLLTGESDAVFKAEGDTVLGGSFVIAGSILVQVSAVGDSMYASRLAQEAKEFKIVDSELIKSIKLIIKWVTIVIIPVGILLIWSQFLVAGNTWQMAIIGSVAGIVGMIPEGLVLLTSIAFMVGVVRLAKVYTLVQELPAVEMLARVDTLCLDKTGTITEGNLLLTNIQPNSGWTVEQMDEALAALSRNLPAANATQIALQQRYDFSNWKAKTIIPFSSSRKWSGIAFETQGTWIMGAPEMVILSDYAKYEQHIQSEAQLGRRVLVLAYSATVIERTMPLDEVQIVGFISFEDIVRKSAVETFSYFLAESVDIKIISGDSPLTVAAVAKKAGLANTNSFFDARYLPTDMEQIRKIVAQTTIFGRVSPTQKKALVMALQANGKTVAMTGDGVNDVLALKQSDCGIAMANGSEATRAVAQLVLLDSDFSALPKVVSEGRKVINNIEQVASLYLVKTLYSMILSLIFIMWVKTYPFLPIQLTYVSSLMVGIPSFFLALAPNDQRVEGRFLPKVMKDTVPGALTIVAFTLLIYLLIPYFEFNEITRRTLSLLLLLGIQFMILLKACRPFNRLKVGLVAIIGFCSLVSIFMSEVQEILMITRLSFFTYLFVMILLIAAYFTMKILEVLLIKLEKKVID
ncbi:MAG: HAD-IC family P-type ATPase [Culicoidibacterales bacterium]